MSLLRLVDVSFRYPGTPSVLDGISVEARDAALVAVVGPNGAGKSTLLDVVAGLKRPAAGRCQVNGLDVNRAGRDEVCRMVAHVPQQTPSGIPFTVEEVVEKMCHAPARMFQVERRGYLREGYQADAVLVDPNAPWTVDRTNVISKCGWSPFEGQQFHTRVLRTWVNGQLAYANGQVNDRVRGERLSFDR